jgi:hypothetical protein
MDESNNIDNHVLYIPKIVPEASSIFRRLMEESPWKEVVWKGGRKLPRLCCHSINKESEPAALMEEWLIVFFHTAYDIQVDVVGCFGNNYRTGKDWLPYHKDQYDDLHVVSISFGATRKFNFQGSRSYNLAEGDIIVFDPYMNKNYTHGIPKQESVKEPRINLTFFVHFRESPYGKARKELNILSPSEIYAMLL